MKTELDLTRDNPGSSIEGLFVKHVTPRMKHWRDDRGPVEVESTGRGFVFYRRDDGELLRMRRDAFAQRFEPVPT